MIIETSDNRFYRVRNHDLPEMAHCYLGVELTRRAGKFAPKYPLGNRRHGIEELVRKAATRIVEQ